jgi:2-polyprenyl-3-methyl-5-hydroxy-6-metoxy-1,4-benzoquinol methylase
VAAKLSVAVGGPVSTCPVPPVRVLSTRDASLCDSYHLGRTSCRSKLARMTEPRPSDALRDVYERRAELEYATPAARPDLSFDRKFERIAELLAARLPCRRFLDAGCGDGRYLQFLADPRLRPERIVATDISERILETAGSAAAAAGVEPELVRANLESLPFDDGSFDVVLCTQVLEHLLDPTAGMSEVARVLTPGGTLVLSTDNSAARVTKLLFAPRRVVVGALRIRGRRLKVHFPEREFSRGELEQLVAGAELEVRELGTFRFTPPPPFGARAQRLLNRIDKRMSPHSVGDILYVVASKR